MIVNAVWYMKIWLFYAYIFSLEQEVAFQCKPHRKVITGVISADLDAICCTRSCGLLEFCRKYTAKRGGNVFRKKLNNPSCRHTKCRFVRCCFMIFAYKIDDRNCFDRRGQGYRHTIFRCNIGIITMSGYLCQDDHCLGLYANYFYMMFTLYQ